MIVLGLIDHVIREALLLCVLSYRMAELRGSGETFVRSLDPYKTGGN